MNRIDASRGTSTWDRLEARQTPHRRVRDEVKDGVAVAAASVAASVALVLVATLLMKLAG